MDGPALVGDCPMVEECPGYDRDRRVCFLRADDCEFAAAAGEAAPVPDTSRADGAASDQEAG